MVVEEGAQVPGSPHVRCIGRHWQVIVGLPRARPVVDPHQQPAHATKVWCVCVCVSSKACKSARVCVGYAPLNEAVELEGPRVDDGGGHAGEVGQFERELALTTGNVQ